jgi:peptidoglycan/LPS O-acetylase OafA/YrhL
MALERVGRWLSQGATGAPMRGLALLGRWSLSYYMGHQPLLIGALSLASLVLKH